MSGGVRVTVLGAGTLLPNHRRRSPAHFVEGWGARWLLDCGSGALHGMDRFECDWKSLSHLFLSHFHTDHVGDVAPLLWALTHGLPEGRDQPLVILGPRGLREWFDALARAHGDFVRDPGFPLEWVELDAGDRWTDPGGHWELCTHSARHTPEALSVRLDFRTSSLGLEGAIGYSGDTGPLPGLGPFFRGVDLLLCECTFPDPAPGLLHLSPRSVAELARQAQPGCLILTHVGPELNLESLPDLLVHHGYTGLVEVGYDGKTCWLGKAERPPAN